MYSKAKGPGWEGGRAVSGTTPSYAPPGQVPPHRALVGWDLKVQRYARVGCVLKEAVGIGLEGP